MPGAGPVQLAQLAATTAADTQAPGVAVVVAHLLVDLAALVVLVGIAYQRRRADRSMAFALVVLNVGLFATLVAITGEAFTTGAGFGLFGMLSLIRLRSASFTTPDMAYTFLALVLGLVTGLTGLPLWVTFGGAALLVALPVLCDRPEAEPVPEVAEPTRRIDVVLDGVYAAPGTARAEVESRLGIPVLDVLVDEVDYVREVTRVRAVVPAPQPMAAAGPVGRTGRADGDDLPAQRADDPWSVGVPVSVAPSGTPVPAPGGPSGAPAARGRRRATPSGAEVFTATVADALGDPYPSTNDPRLVEALGFPGPSGTPVSPDVPPPPPPHAGPGEYVPAGRSRGGWATRTATAAPSAGAGRGAGHGGNDRYDRSDRYDGYDRLDGGSDTLLPTEGVVLPPSVSAMLPPSGAIDLPPDVPPPPRVSGPASWHGSGR